jgi:hypothetical protein
MSRQEEIQILQIDAPGLREIREMTLRLSEAFHSTSWWQDRAGHRKSFILARNGSHRGM